CAIARQMSGSVDSILFLRVNMGGPGKLLILPRIMLDQARARGARVLRRAGGAAYDYGETSA
ncbi:MAG: hypothetical protein OEZ08_15255, partial [Betaproteobacteria bacterium]|nr:hypothetical protein [Betaproteobacteria bacterium]